MDCPQIYIRRFDDCPRYYPPKQAFFSLSEGWVNPNFEEKQGFFRVRHTTPRSRLRLCPHLGLFGLFILRLWSGDFIWISPAFSRISPENRHLTLWIGQVRIDATVGETGSSWLMQMQGASGVLRGSTGNQAICNPYRWNHPGRFSMAGNFYRIFPKNFSIELFTGFFYRIFLCRNGSGIWQDFTGYFRINVSGAGFLVMIFFTDLFPLLPGWDLFFCLPPQL